MHWNLLVWGAVLSCLTNCDGGTEPPGLTSADIKVNGGDGPVAVGANVSVQLSWNSENATSCQVTPGGWSGTTGSATVEDLTATTTYRLSCTGPAGDAQDSVHIVLTPPGTEIVFQGDSFSVYVVNADGSGLTRLTDAGAAPSWSGDGRQIYFLSYGGLYAMNADGNDVHFVVDSISGLYAVSPDGMRIAFGVWAPPGPEEQSNIDLFIMNLDGSERAPLVNLPCDEYYTHCEYLKAIAWSPDGQRIAYSGCWGGHGSESCNIQVVNADGSGQRVVTSFEAHHTEPAWAPDGQRIVFPAGASRSTLFYPWSLEIINADGSGGMFLNSVSGLATASPSWSPDGQSIVFEQFVSDWSGTQPSELFVVNVDGTGLRRLATLPGGAFAPKWNPAGR